MQHILGEIMGIIAGICTAIVFLPQSIQTIKTKNTAGLSLSSYVIYVCGMLAWITYGFYLGSIQMIVFNTISLIFAVIILYIIVQNQK